MDVCKVSLEPRFSRNWASQLRKALERFIDTVAHKFISVRIADIAMLSGNGFVTW